MQNVPLEYTHYVVIAHNNKQMPTLTMINKEVNIIFVTNSIF